MFRSVVLRTKAISGATSAGYTGPSTTCEMRRPSRSASDSMPWGGRRGSVSPGRSAMTTVRVRSGEPDLPNLTTSEFALGVQSISHAVPHSRRAGPPDVGNATVS